jgi:hypothetical protein
VAVHLQVVFGGWHAVGEGEGDRVEWLQNRGCIWGSLYLRWGWTARRDGADRGVCGSRPTRRVGPAHALWREDVSPEDAPKPDSVTEELRQAAEQLRQWSRNVASLDPQDRQAWSQVLADEAGLVASVRRTDTALDRRWAEGARHWLGRPSPMGERRAARTDAPLPFDRSSAGRSARPARSARQQFRTPPGMDRGDAATPPSLASHRGCPAGPR